MRFRVIYGFGGFLPPIKQDGSGIYQRDRTLPIKFQLTDANGNPVSTASAYLFIAKVENGVVNPEEAAISTSVANEGNRFRYDDKDHQYIFNLDTSPFTAGTWRARVALDDGRIYTAIISIK